MNTMHSSKSSFDLSCEKLRSLICNIHTICVHSLQVSNGSKIGHFHSTQIFRKFLFNHMLAHASSPYKWCMQFVYENPCKCSIASKIWRVSNSENEMQLFRDIYMHSTKFSENIKLNLLNFSCLNMEYRQNSNGRICVFQSDHQCHEKKHMSWAMMMVHCAAIMGLNFSQKMHGFSFQIMKTHLLIAHQYQCGKACTISSV